MEYELAYYSSVGRRRNNEDAVSVKEGPGALLALVADGLGGQDNGEYASACAIDTLGGLPLDAEPSETVMEKAFERANTEVRRLQREHPGAQTTLAALWLRAGRALAMHIGDTRIYQMRGGEIVYQSADHSLSQLAVMAGELEPEDIRGDRDRNKLFRALGDRSAPRVGFAELDVLPLDRFLVCSDGFWEKIWEDEMLLSAGRCPDAESWLDDMRRAAEPEAADNNTAIAIIARDGRT